MHTNPSRPALESQAPSYAIAGWSRVLYSRTRHEDYRLLEAPAELLNTATRTELVDQLPAELARVTAEKYPKHTRGKPRWALLRFQLANRDWAALVAYGYCLDLIGNVDEARAYQDWGHDRFGRAVPVIAGWMAPWSVWQLQSLFAWPCPCGTEAAAQAPMAAHGRALSLAWLRENLAWDDIAPSPVEALAPWCGKDEVASESVLRQFAAPELRFAALRLLPSGQAEFQDLGGPAKTGLGDAQAEPTRMHELPLRNAGSASNRADEAPHRWAQTREELERGAAHAPHAAGWRLPANPKLVWQKLSCLLSLFSFRRSQPHHRQQHASAEARAKPQQKARKAPMPPKAASARSALPPSASSLPAVQAPAENTNMLNL